MPIMECLANLSNLGFCLTQLRTVSRLAMCLAHSLGNSSVTKGVDLKGEGGGWGKMDFSVDFHRGEI